MITLPLAVIQAAGAFGDAAGSYFNARTSRTNARYQADIQRVNARIADLQYRDAMIQGRRQEQASRMKTAQTKSSTRTALAANGIDVNSGLADALNASTSYVGETDANTIAANAIKTAWGFKTEASGMRSAAAMTDASADSFSPTMAGMTSLLGSASRVAPSWYQLGKMG